MLEDNGYEVVESETPELAKFLLKQHTIDLILLDMNYTRDTTSGDEGMCFLAWLEEQALAIPVVAMTAWANIGLAVKAMQLGASDFIEKPWKNQRLLQVISQQLTLTELKQQNLHLQQRIKSSGQPSSEYKWRSACMTELLEQIQSVAATNVPVLLTGENGTGKSELANYIHLQSNKPDAPFIAVNMGAIADNLFESEMFGHKKGAFTDAKNSRIGRLELAESGTLFLDEIANIPLSQQAKLLRVLENGQYEVLGSSETLTCNVRMISASNGNFQQLIASGLFREDLYFRINTLEFRVPPLKERREDIVPLAKYFVSRFCEKYNKPNLQLSHNAVSTLSAYQWPGNIREMSHVIERVVLLCNNPYIDASDLYLKAGTNPKAVTPDTLAELPLMTLECAEKQLIRQALRETEQSVPKAAKILGLTKSSLYRRLDKYGDI